jgi:hypothetical protein
MQSPSKLMLDQKPIYLGAVNEEEQPKDLDCTTNHRENIACLEAPPNPTNV